VTAGEAYTFTPAVTDPGHDRLTFSIVNRPAWTTFSTATGQLSGAPTTANVGAFANILISMSNGSLTLSLPVFSIHVQPPTDSAPTIAVRLRPRSSPEAVIPSLPLRVILTVIP